MPAVHREQRTPMPPRALNRRDFLKLAGSALPSLLAPAGRHVERPRPNVLIVVFDALSACHLPLHGYGRDTAPHLTRWAQRAIVYHNHFAGGNWTVPGTATLLTGTLPWTHRAFNYTGDLAPHMRARNLFRLFDGYHRLAASHNPLAAHLLSQWHGDIDEWIPLSRLLLTHDGLVQDTFEADELLSSLAWERLIKRPLNGGRASSLFLSRLYRDRTTALPPALADEFPRGVPQLRGDRYFVLEHAIDFAAARLQASLHPFLAYFHFLPPHYPYRAPREFIDRFAQDGFRTPVKPADPDFSKGRRSSGRIFPLARRLYDEFILYVDREFDRLMTQLQQAGLLDDTWVVLTSDHGELFERAIIGHLTPMLYQPIVRVPLLIFEPGRTQRLDVRRPTSSADLLPTLLHVTGLPAVDWTEGLVLPPFAASPPDHPVFAIEAMHNHPRQPLTRASMMLVRDRFKLTRYLGQSERNPERVELYDLEADPEELADLSRRETGLTAELLDELQTMLTEVDQPYL